MATNNLSITIGVMVLDESKGTENKFCSAGFTYHNANQVQLQAIHEVSPEIIELLTPVAEKLKELGYVFAIADPKVQAVKEHFQKDKKKH